MKVVFEKFAGCIEHLDRMLMELSALQMAVADDLECSIGRNLVSSRDRLIDAAKVLADARAELQDHLFNEPDIANEINQRIDDRCARILLNA